MRIGIVCPYSWDIAGGVQFHIRDLAEELIGRGHEVSVLAPAENTHDLPDYLVSAGPAIPIHYNGSVARLAFGPRMNMRVRAWLKTGRFDIVHVHEPFIPSLSMLALVAATCPVVATFHTALERSVAFNMASPMLRSVLEKLSARIAVSGEARRTAVQYLGGDAFVIPNGVYTRNFSTARRDERFTGTAGRPTLAFLGRLDEPRKGLALVAAAFDDIRAAHPGVRLFVAGHGDCEEAARLFGNNAEAVTFLGSISEEEKAALLASVDMYLAPNTGGESFGIILIEAMAAGAFVVASDIPAFQAVLASGTFGVHFANNDPQSLATTVNEWLDKPDERAAIAQRAQEESGRYDWQSVASQVFAAYETALRTEQIEVE
ncbi:MAG: glycosyltransferase family 4 protein [Actinomycetaceae bacterium]|nr:glycosyltransferase family 4 protein [Actinomycetaceae bacterium]